MSEQFPRAAASYAPRLNLGSGEDYRHGDWENLDYNDRYNPDWVHDLNEPDGWPFPDVTFEYVLASHVFEHLDDLAFQFAEAARVLKPGGTLEVRYPTGENAKTDPTHTHKLTYDSALWFAQNWREYSDDYQLDPSAPFDLVERDLNVVVHGPLRVTARLLDYLLRNREPGVWATAWPSSSGEVIATYTRLED